MLLGSEERQELEPSEVERFTKPHMSRQDIDGLLSFRSRNIEYYRQAFVHKSILRILTNLPKENVPKYMMASNERMEFLGDSILSGITAMYLYERFPDKDEGFLTKTRSKLVDTRALSGYARKLEMGQFLLMSRRLIKLDGANKDKMLENCMEALIGAIYLDLGIEHATVFVHNLFNKHTNWSEVLTDTNYKDQLLKYCHAQGVELPIYEIVSTDGPSHNKTFTVRVIVRDQDVGTGVAKRKGDAEQMAANMAITMFQM